MRASGGIHVDPYLDSAGLKGNAQLRGLGDDVVVDLLHKGTNTLRNRVNVGLPVIVPPGKSNAVAWRKLGAGVGRGGHSFGRELVRAGLKGFL